MKTNRLNLLLLSALAFGAAADHASAIVSPKGIFLKTSALIEKVEEDGSQVIFGKIDHIEKDASNTLSLNLRKGNKYMVFALGDDERVTDVDLTVKDESDYIIGTDEDEKNLALVKISPKWDGKFFLTVTAAQMAEEVNDAFFSVLIVRLGEDPVPAQTIMSRLAENLGTAEAKQRQVLYGQIDTVDHDGPSTVTYHLHADTKYLALAIGDGTRVTDLDMKVIDEKGRNLGSDEYQSNEASVVFVPREDGIVKFVVGAANMKSGVSDAFYGLVLMRLSK